MEKEDIEKQEAIKELKRFFRKGGYKAYTKLDHVSRSGMMRYISVMVLIGGEPYHLDHLIARLGHYKRVPFGKHSDGLIVYGCGMDMGFDVVYNTSSVVFPDKEENVKIAKKLGRMRNGEYEDSGGYIVRQEWI